MGLADNESLAQLLTKSLNDVLPNLQIEGTSSANGTSSKSSDADSDMTPREKKCQEAFKKGKFLNLATLRKSYELDMMDVNEEGK